MSLSTPDEPSRRGATTAAAKAKIAAEIRTPRRQPLLPAALLMSGKARDRAFRVVVFFDILFTYTAKTHHRDKNAVAHLNPTKIILMHVGKMFCIDLHFEVRIHQSSIASRIFTL